MEYCQNKYDFIQKEIRDLLIFQTLEARFIYFAPAFTCDQEVF